MKASGFFAIALSLCMGVTASAQDTFTVDIVGAGGTVQAGDVVEFTIEGDLTDTSNEGLAFFALDLELTGPNPVELGTAILMAGSPGVDSFSAPQGYSVDFTGTAIGNDLIQAGGGQNTIGNPGTPPFPPFPNGSVVLNVGHGGVEMYNATGLIGGGLTLPNDLGDGDYTLQIKPGSLYANVITSVDGDSYVVDPVDTVIGTSLDFSVGADCDPLEIDHVSGLTTPCSGFIDPAIESTDGTNVDLGITELTIAFNQDVFKSDGSDIDAANFSVNETGGGSAPTVASAVYGADNTQVVVTLNRPITPGQWSTVIADVYNVCGDAIVSTGDLGGDNEPDRVDVAGYPGDVDQNGGTTPFDLLAARQGVQNGTVPGGCSGELNDYLDINRDTSTSPFDILALRQIIQGVSPATRVWPNEDNLTARP